MQIIKEFDTFDYIKTKSLGFFFYQKYHEEYDYTSHKLEKITCNTYYQKLLVYRIYKAS